LDNNATQGKFFPLCPTSSKSQALENLENAKDARIRRWIDRIVFYGQERLMTGKVIGLIVSIQIFLMNSTAWADSDGLRPEILDIGEERSLGVLLAVVFSLIIIGFGIGFLVGRHTSKNAKKS
jgi:hypothetical protein